MSEIPKFSAVVNSISAPTTTFLEMIKERKVLKTKIKLMHILYFDSDIIELHKQKLSLQDIRLSDFYLNQDYDLIVPVKDRIIPLEPDDTINLKCYFIYLSYLYNVNFLEIYQQNPNYFYKLIFDLHISENIKQNLFYLLNLLSAPYFSECMEELNNADFRENLKEDQMRLIKKLQPFVK